MQTTTFELAMQMLCFMATGTFIGGVVGFVFYLCRFSVFPN